MIIFLFVSVHRRHRSPTVWCQAKLVCPTTNHLLTLGLPITWKRHAEFTFAIIDSSSSHLGVLTASIHYTLFVLMFVVRRNLHPEARLHSVKALAA